MTRVKICGIKRVSDALAAIEFGADAIGVLVGQCHASTDFITPELAAEIYLNLPPCCSFVLVTHLCEPDAICKLATTVGAGTIQLHGGTTLRRIAEIRRRLPTVKLIKAVHVTGPEALSQVEKFQDAVDCILLDTFSAATNQVGGTGKTHDWSLSAQITATCSKPVILAGGLNCTNVAAAIELVKPFGVDVNSGTKGADGYKDRTRLRDFIFAARHSPFAVSS